MELINEDSTSQRNKTVTGWENVWWPGVLVFDKFPEVIMFSEYARIQILKLLVRWK